MSCCTSAPDVSKPRLGCQAQPEFARIPRIDAQRLLHNSRTWRAHTRTKRTDARAVTMHTSRVPQTTLRPDKATSRPLSTWRSPCPQCCRRCCSRSRCPSSRLGTSALGAVGRRSAPRTDPRCTKQAGSPLFWRPTQRSAAISVYVHPPRKNTTVVVGRSLGSTVGRRAHGGGC